MDSHAAPHTNGLKTDLPTMADTAPAQHNALSIGYSNGTIKEEDELLPPELEHWAHTYVPMGKLLERMAQQCYFELGDLVEQMADLNIAAPQTNGASTSAPDVSKARFIKALVLSDWARNMGDMDKLIELRMWLTQQDEATSLVANSIVNMKTNMVAAKMPNPNIEGALELLSTSKAPWLPDLGYIAPKPLSAQKLLKTLRDMNFVLSVRLNLHEQLPSHFCNYSIANGRATFVVPDEFELDLAVTDEDTTSPFYFIDIRFLFSDAPPLPDGYARQSLEGKVNQILQLEGLSAAYEFLHGFVLTHKISLLRRQAFELSRTRWTECLHVEPIHRSLVVQYWTGQPGGKSWIEVGIVKGSNGQSSERAHTPARLNIRWFRAGKEVPDVRFDIDAANPSMEQILNQVTAAHMTLRLGTVRDQIVAISPPNSALAIDLNVSSTDPNACALSTKLGQHGSETILRIIPVNGNISISPVSSASIDVERRLNADPSIDAAQIVTYLNCKLVQDQITRQAVQAGWLLMPTDKQADTNKVFQEQIVRRTTFTRHGWGEDWAICLTISLQGVKWWIVHLTYTSPTSRIITTAETLAIPSTTKLFDRQTVMLIESRAVAQVSLSNISSQLRAQNISHEIRHVAASASAQANTSSSPLSSSTTTAVIGMKFEDVMQPSSPVERKTWIPWCGSTMVLTHHGVDETAKDTVKVIHVLKTTLTPQTAETLSPLINKPVQDISFSPNGILALALPTHFGVDLLQLIKTKLSAVERLASCLSALKSRNFAVEKATMQGLVFVYSSPSAPFTLKAGIAFTNQGIHLRFPAAHDNETPHRRILPLLQKLLETPVSCTSPLQESARFENLLNLLHATTPLFSAFTRIENKDSSGKQCKAFSRSLVQHRLVYSEPLHPMVLEIEFRRKEGKDFWSVTLVKNTPDSAEKKEKSLDLLAKAWQGKDLPGVKGFRSGIIADVDAIGKILIAIDEVVRGEEPRVGNGNGNGDGQDIVVLD
ncbi:MED14-domain-containing protein [Aureobasidium subglaciale]|nr:MED14-domain-containing protein [Aureobasidium subglaciale]KAI5219132.1 MED14-domain-containing protein [Aureobasidium subglaciale]KAI5233183.1 MED14-domain-containing protein [Aureobasidium subglaciale]KAI5260021.1 MED14-domain-containing protein [Aureobasidium subglaciale]